MNFSDTEDEVAAAERSSALDWVCSAARRFPDGRKTKRLSPRALGLVFFLISWRDLETTQIHFARVTSVKVREGLRGLLTGLLMSVAPLAESIFTEKKKNRAQAMAQFRVTLNPTLGAFSSTGHCDALMTSVMAGTVTYGRTWPKHSNKINNLRGSFAALPSLV